MQESNGQGAQTYSGGCLCGGIRFVSASPPEFPHLCSCTQCQKWSGAPTVAWVDFPLSTFEWLPGPVEPHWFRSSDRTQRCSCPACGSSLAAFDDGSEVIGIVVTALDDPSAVLPDVQHSFADSAPDWWHVAVQRKEP